MDLNFKQFGQGDPIIILHGLFGMLDNWQTIAKQLAKNYTVFIIDQRNHGKSPHHPDFDYSIMAEDLQCFMEANWIYESHIIGHSMGGKTAMKFALEYPDLIDKLVIVDIAPKQYEGGHQLIFEALFSLDLEKTLNRKQAEEKLAEKITDLGVRQFLLKNLTRKKEGGYAWKMYLDAIYKNYDHILDGINGTPIETETLFIAGERSNYIQDSDYSVIQNLFPESNIKTIPDCGHWVHAEKPKELLAMITDFFE